MKKLLFVCSLAVSFSASAQQFSNLTRQDVENVTREVGVNFSHTVVSSPQTNGGWGVEVGLVAGQTPSPDFKDVVVRSGGSGSDVENLYHAGLAARVHFPFDVFAELNVFPERTISDISVRNRSFGLGWNFGGFFNLPVDVAVGMGRSNGEISFSQTTPVNADVTLETTSTLYWIGVSKTFLLVTPYLKLGTSQIEGDLSATGNILGYSVVQKDTVNMSGGYLAVGATIDLTIFSFGVEHTQMQDVRRTSARIGLSF